MPQGSQVTHSGETVDIDAIVVGAGFGGLRALHKLRDELGLSVRLIEAGSDVGGTWYWNRYPGARTDSEAWAYCYSFSKELQDEWDWPERMPTWNQVQEYLAFVADRFDMRKDIAFDTRVASAVFDEASGRWLVTTEDGQRFNATYFVTAVGWFSVAYEPPFKGLESFEGQWIMSSRWPKESVDFTGKRVGIVGSGSTAVQLLPIVAQTAEHVSLFQRTPNYVLPGRNHPLDEWQRQSIKTNYDSIWQQVRRQVFAFPMETSTYGYDDVTEEERLRIFEAGWEAGGFRFLFETFADLLIDERSNAAAAEFVRGKIRSIVKDPKTAELLCPDYPIALKRPPLGNFYFEAFNRDNVSLVDVREHPIAEILPNGISTGVAEYDLDIIVFAMGFDAVTGPLTHMDVRGRGGVSVREKWSEGPRTHLGITIDGFPNMFVITGPQAPFANVPPIVESAVSWIGEVITRMQDQSSDLVEAKPEAVDRWVRLMWELLDATLLGQATELSSWFMGANIPGKAHAPLHYFGGAEGYFNEVQHSIDTNFEGLRFSQLVQSHSAPGLAARGG
jgi:cation diffusion facilitator CzcD-associated flavoprotein CzcO